MGSHRRRSRVYRRLADQAARAGYPLGAFGALLVEWSRIHSTPPATLEQVEEELLVR